MEQHPVPQNVTTFQFRLIGDMTLKQFGYLAGGAILAYIFYKLPLPLFLNWPFAIIFAIGGFGFAFVPIEERPMDVWVLSFFKSIYSPTQYVWSRDAAAKPAEGPASPGERAVAASASHPLAPTTVVREQTPPSRGDILSGIFTPPATTGATGTSTSVLQREKPPGILDWFFELLMPKPRTTASPVPAAAAAAVSYPSTISAKMDFTPPPSVRTRTQTPPEPKAPPPVQKPTDVVPKTATANMVSRETHEAVQRELADLQAQRDKMEAELARLRVQNTPPPPKPTGTYVATPAASQGPSVRVITADRAVKVGIPRLTTFPNVVTGIVKDGDQNLLPGVLVTVKDKEGVPVRALKTNRLGQFAASTPLTNGTYYVEIEDPRFRYTFDRAQITLNGSIVPALEIFAKSQKEITRAKLEKELFGAKPS